MVVTHISLFENVVDILPDQLMNYFSAETCLKSMHPSLEETLILENKGMLRKSFSLTFEGPSGAQRSVVSLTVLCFIAGYCWTDTDQDLLGHAQTNSRSKKSSSRKPQTARNPKQ